MLECQLATIAAQDCSTCSAQVRAWWLPGRGCWRPSECHLGGYWTRAPVSSRGGRQQLPRLVDALLVFERREQRAAFDRPEPGGEVVAHGGGNQWAPMLHLLFARRKWHCMCGIHAMHSKDWCSEGESVGYMMLVILGQ
jgi:hypothetical protein